MTGLNRENMNIQVVDLTKEVIGAIQKLGQNPSSEAVGNFLITYATNVRRMLPADHNYATQLAGAALATTLSGGQTVDSGIEVVGLETGEHRVHFGAQVQASAVFLTPAEFAGKPPAAAIYVNGRVMLIGNKDLFPKDQLAIYPNESDALEHITKDHAKPKAKQCTSDIPDAATNTKVLTGGR